MKTVLAALDATAAARPVLETALGMGALTGATVEAVHVRNRSVETPEQLAAQSGVTLRVIDGEVEASLLDAVSAPEVVAAVFGARTTPGGRRPVGRTSLHILRNASKPVVVVPPDVVGESRSSLRRLLVPLDGTVESSRAIAESLAPLVVAETEIVVLHVFTVGTVPPTLDRPVRDLSLWGSEFLARFCDIANRIELRTGSVGDNVADVCEQEAADLVVLSWSQDLSADHAAVIHDVLSRSSIPVLLLPVERPTAG